MARNEQIQELAYQIWQQESCPEGKASEHYFRAKQILEAQEDQVPKNEASEPALPVKQKSEPLPDAKPKKTATRKPRSKKAS